MKYTEAKLEQSFIELLATEGYEHCLGETIARIPEEVIIEADLKQFLQEQYANEGITDTEIKQIVLQLKKYPSSDLYESNKAIMSMVSEGFILKRDDRNKKDIFIQLIDYKGLTVQKQANPEHLINVMADDPVTFGDDNNIYKFVNQLEIFGSEKRIPDGILLPWQSWRDEKAYQVQSNRLAKMFADNFEQYASGVDEKIRRAGPKVAH